MTSHEDGEEPREVGTLVRQGWAETRGQAVPLGVDDPVIAARAVRRALAHAGRHARDVEAMVLATGRPGPDAGALRRFARRALGPHGAEVALRQILPPAGRGDDARRLARLAEDALVGRRPPSPRTVWIAVGVGDDGVVVATCLARLTRRSAPRDR